MAGKTKPPRDADGKYRKKCTKLAERLGWRESYICGVWNELALMIECEQRAPRNYAEDVAYRYVKAVFCNQGSAEAS